MARVLAGSILTAAALLAAPPPDPAGQAREAVAGLAAKLKALLGEELAKGGFEGAVHACSTSAQKITREFAAKSGVDIRRVTLKYRNPANAPDAWERAQLEQWEATLKSGKPLPEEVWTIVEQPPTPSSRERREPGSATTDQRDPASSNRERREPGSSLPTPCLTPRQSPSPIFENPSRDGPTRHCRVPAAHAARRQCNDGTNRVLFSPVGTSNGVSQPWSDARAERRHAFCPWIGPSQFCL